MYIREIVIFEQNLEFVSGDPVGTSDEKNRGKKSHATVPLRISPAKLRI
jgi:hypothetical protein